MKKTIKVLLSMALICIMLASLCVVNVFAANSIISFNKNSVTVGENVTVTVSLNAGEAIYGISCVINYNSEILEYKSGNASGSAGTLKLVEAPSGETKVSYQLTFTAKKAGSCPISIVDANYSGLTEDKGITGTAATLTVQDKTLSSNANLKSLYVNNGKLSPNFSPNITSYEVKVKNSITECKISATPADPSSKVAVEGSANLQVGSNTRTVIVTSASGSVKKYTVVIIRSETDEEEKDPLEVNIGGASMYVATDLSTTTLFNGFTATEADYGESKVPVAVDEAGIYKIYYLRDPADNSLVPYTFDADANLFEKLKYYTQGEKTYIFADIPSDKSVPEPYYTTNAQIAGMDVKCYASSGQDESDFYYIYCYTGGEYGFYRYDSRENVFQRFPTLKLTDVVSDHEEENESNKLKDKLGAFSKFLERWGALTRNEKIVVIVALFVLLAVLSLIVILIVKLVTRKKNLPFDDEMMEDDFDEVVVDSFDSDLKI